MIVGTAGHIDHGKTTLVRLLTGVDTDRLPEEKRRGISIELGYAYLDVPAAADGAPAGRIGFVDVPGHERLVATMLSGASGIDHALLVVAADDGVMPQTREHVAGLALLGIGRGTVAITKVDRADAARVAEVQAEVRALLAGTPLAGAPIHAVSATTGDGIERLRAHLLGAARAHAADPRGDDAHGFRLAIDRVFSLAGIGTVATGTAHAGAIEVGAALALAPGPAGGAPRSGRARSLHAQDARVERAAAGQRVAVNVVGLDKDEIERGAWLVEPEVALATDRVDVELVVWRHEGRPLRSGTTVHAHIGSRDAMATVAVLADRPRVVGEASARAGGIAPGDGGRVQLVLRERIAAWRGDRVVLRDATARRMVAGGRILDPHAPARYRQGAERLAELDALAAPTPAERLSGLLAVATNGVDLDRFRRAEGRLALPPLPADALAVAARDGASALAPGRGASASSPGQGAPAPAYAFGAAAAAAWLDRIEHALDASHAEQPDELGPDAARLRRRIAPRLADPAWRALVERAVADGRVARSHGRLHRPAHAVRLSSVEQRIAERALPQLLDGGFDPPWLRTLAADLREPEATLRAALLRLAQRGELHAVVKDLFYPPRTMAKAAAIARRIAARDGAVTAAAFRDATGLGRKRAIQIIEYFDRAGLLRRVGDEHRLRPDCDLFGGAEGAAN